MGCTVTKARPKVSFDNQHSFTFTKEMGIVTFGFNVTKSTHKERRPPYNFVTWETVLGL